MISLSNLKMNLVDVESEKYILVTGVVEDFKNSEFRILSSISTGSNPCGCGHYWVHFQNKNNCMKDFKFMDCEKFLIALNEMSILKSLNENIEIIKKNGGLYNGYICHCNNGDLKCFDDIL